MKQLAGLFRFSAAYRVSLQFCSQLSYPSAGKEVHVQVQQQRNRLQNITTQMGQQKIVRGQTPDPVAKLVICSD